VLGFYDREVSKYINRENTISSILGIIVGLFLGIPLDRFILKTAEIDNLMFVPGLPPSCFIYAVVLTLGFTFIVNFVLHHTLRNVDMIESLKSIE
jgi:putative ABC transport system permease protein